MGAEVIKVETKIWPDQMRRSSLTTGDKSADLEHSRAFNDVNLNKLSVTLDLSRPEGSDLAKKIIGVSDVVVQNLRWGRIESFDLSYESAREVKPDIIYLSSSAEGKVGPGRKHVGYAPTFAALGGASYITGYVDCPPSQLMGEVDELSAITSTFAILAALNYRQRTGQGQYIDVSSCEVVSSLIGEVLLDYTMNGRVQSRKGNGDDFMAPHNCYRCKGDDKWVSIAIATDEEWTAFCSAIGNPGWTEDGRFCDARARRENEEELDRLIGDWTLRHTHYRVMEVLQEAGVAAMPCFNSQELFGDQHLKERGFWAEVEHPVIGKQAVVAPPWKLSATPARIYGHAPLLGEHNQYVFGELLGLSPTEIVQLVAGKVIY